MIIVTNPEQGPAAVVEMVVAPAVAVVMEVVQVQAMVAVTEVVIVATLLQFRLV